MSPIISASELDLLTFFEVEPTFLDAKNPWPYTDALYQIQQGELSLSFAVAPAFRDVKVILKHGGQVLYELNAMGVEDVKYHNDSGRESLGIALANGDHIFIKLKPNVSLSHSSSERT